ncbi:hypothetical protein FRC09_008058 [Ceratobasidium sp. 395]|nr:hypothetical protein FRC09_008058 [Ceratobasidium sp. 395]
MSASTVSKPVSAYGHAKTLQVLRAVERLGGSAGYLKYLSELNKPKAPPKLLTRSDAPAEGALVSFVAALFYGWADVMTLSSNHTTTLEGWGFGVMDAEVYGEVMLNVSWDEMLSGPMDYGCGGVGAEGGILVITFTRNGRELGQITSGGVVTGVGAFSGTCTWR